MRTRWAAALSIFIVLPSIAIAQDSRARSIAPAQLQADALPAVLAAAQTFQPSCAQPSVADKFFNGWAGAAQADAARPWEETWAVDLCGRIVDVLVQFAPDAAGVRFAVPANAVHMRP